MEQKIEFQSEIKKNIINLLMFSLYADARTIYREYVQNALDSINNAVKVGILQNVKDGVVNVTIDKRNNCIQIRDNGTGIGGDAALNQLLNISNSSKDGITAAGQFGIGRLVGGGYCHKLVFKTSSKGESFATQVTFNVDDIWKMVKEDKEEYPATYVIDKCTIKERFEENEAEHYFEVSLYDVKKEMAAILLDEKAIAKYLSVVAPVEYKTVFNNAVIFKSVQQSPEYKALHEGLEKVQLFVGAQRIQKQYGLTVNGTKDKINNLEYFKIESDKYGMLGWGWFALTKFTVQIAKDDELAGIRLRKHNIQIGDFALLSGKPLWKEDRSNSYFYGEFFATHPNLVPNAARDGLAPTPEKEALYASLTEYFRKLYDVYSKANSAKKAIEKINEGVQKIKSNHKEDRAAKDLIDNKGIAVFDKLIKNATFVPLKHMLELYRPDYEEAKRKVKEYRGIITETIQPELELPTISETSSESKTTSSFPQTYNQVSDVDVSDTPFGGEETEHPSLIVQNPVSPTTHPANSMPASAKRKKDIIAPLNAVLDENEIWMLRRVFRVLNTYCPKNEHDQKLIENLEEMIVREFENGN